MPTKAQQELKDKIIDLAKRAKLDSWNSFVEELKVPNELVPALVTMRVELIKLAPVRELSAEECKALYDLIGGLIETNLALREHANQVAQVTKNWIGGIRGQVSSAERLMDFAEFRHEDAAAEDEED